MARHDTEPMGLQDLYTSKEEQGCMLNFAI